MKKWKSVSVEESDREKEDEDIRDFVVRMTSTPEMKLASSDSPAFENKMTRILLNFCSEQQKTPTPPTPHKLPKPRMRTFPKIKLEVMGKWSMLTILIVTYSAVIFAIIFTVYEPAIRYEETRLSGAPCMAPITQQNDK
jgi:hypothetical protein